MAAGLPHIRDLPMHHRRRSLRPRNGRVAPARHRRAGGLLAPHSSLGDSFAHPDGGELQCSLRPPACGLERIQKDPCGSIAVACWGWDSYPSSPSLGFMTFFTAAATALAIGVRGGGKVWMLCQLVVFVQFS